MSYRTSWTQLTPNFPSISVSTTTTAHDVLLAWAIGDTPNETFTWPSGFTQLARQLVTVDGGTLGVAIKLDATGSEGSLSITAANGNIIGGIIAFSGRDNTTNPDVTSATGLLNTNTASPWSVSAGSLTPANAGDDLAIFMMSDVGNLFTGAVVHSFSGDGLTYTKVADYTEAPSGGSRCGAVAYATHSGTSAVTVTGTGTQAGESAGAAIVVVPLKAAAGGGGTAYTLTSAQGSFTVSGQVNLAKWSEFITQGSYAVNGQAAILTYTPVGSTAYTLTAVQGSYTNTGQTAGLLYGYSMPITTGTYTVTGSDALVDYAFPAIQGTYSLTGQTVTLTYTPAAASTNYTLTVAQGSITLSGQSNVFGASMNILKGSFVLTGRPASLTWSGAQDEDHHHRKLGLNHNSLSI